MPTVTDNFNRANETPLAGNWTESTATGEPNNFNLTSNQVIVANPSSFDANAFYNAVTFAADQSSAANLTCSGTVGTGAGLGIGLCVRRVTTAATKTYYRFAIDHAASNNARISRMVAGTSTTLATWTQAWTDGDLFEYRVAGPASAPVLTIYLNGVQVQTVTDNSSLASGQPGLFYSGSEAGTCSIDNWTGTDVFTTFTPALARLPRSLGPRAAGPLYFATAARQIAALDVVTPISDSDSGTGTDDGTVSATVPGSDSSTGTDAGTVSATASDSDTSTGSDTGSVSAAVPGSDSGTGTDTGTAADSGPGADSGIGTDTGTVNATITGSESGTGTDDQVSIVSPVSGSDTATGSETDSASVTGSGGDTGSGSDTASTAVTATGADSATGTDAGTVADITAGATPVSDSDSGTGSEAGTVLDLTPPPVAPGGGAAFDEDLGDTSTVDLHRKTGADTGHATETSSLVDLTPRKRLRIVLPSRKPRRTLESAETAGGAETARITVGAAAYDAGHAVEGSMMVDLTAEEEDERLVLGLLGIDV